MSLCHQGHAKFRSKTSGTWLNEPKLEHITSITINNYDDLNRIWYVKTPNSILTNSFSFWLKKMAYNGEKVRKFNGKIKFDQTSYINNWSQEKSGCKWPLCEFPVLNVYFSKSNSKGRRETVAVSLWPPSALNVVSWLSSTVNTTATLNHFFNNNKRSARRN
jgi:hypothetical protein